MIVYFSLSIRFLDSRFHGRGEGGEPEWPPSPLRVFQALVNSAARMDRGSLSTSSQEAFQWLGRRSEESPPIILAPPYVFPGQESPGYRLSMPNNALDIVARAWCKGNYTNSGDASPAAHRTMKTVRPVHLIDGDTVQFLWPLPGPLATEDHAHVEVLKEIAGKITALGWGVDMAVGQGAILSEEEANALSGERWLPGTRAEGNGLRVPVNGTLDDLMTRHKGFINRLDHGVFTPPPPLSVYDKIEYRRATDPPQRGFVAFSLLKPDGSGFRAFDTVRRALTVAGMTRHAACLAATGRRSEAWVNSFILGHGEPPEEEKHVTVGSRRFAFLPLPSIESRGEGQARVVGNIRRVILSTFEAACEEEINWARRTLSGQGLVEKKRNEQEAAKDDPAALLSLLPNNEKVVQSYVRSSATWATVTPVVLPGYDDPAHYRRRLKRAVTSEEQKRLLRQLDERIDGLLRKAITQAGFPSALAGNAELAWRKVGYWRGNDLADRYGVPDHLRKFPRYHVKITWRDEHRRQVRINGPVCLGGGRFYGLGLFAAFNE